ncbi:glycosyltransferase family 4 protein [Lacisediminihabitans profunda]|uniref:Glycosyltransferase family 4 protein n=1 Tax=Lacisediminihabitans profunda TaxID=2594790 RepID=A0A5C8UKC0_9MICO|nr:glycosyltransferase family 4 protein [Lacisediminihabitans profunda]TXN28792.1 glycosyltransferase family 4 protein [Lacisediminihabitans profunda]
MSAVGKAFSILKTEGIRSTAWRSAKYLSNRFSPFVVTPLSTVYTEDVIAVDWTKPRAFNAVPMEGRDGKYRIAWVISPPSRTSGGHQNAFRFMSFLEKAGHELTVYLYSPGKYPVVNVDEIRAMMHGMTGYPDLVGDMRLYDPAEGFAPGFDAIFASDWEATYAAYRYEGEAKRFYFAQDFEPYFFAEGSDYVLAENSYRLGFHGIAAGQWLGEKLRSEYGMSCDAYDFAVDTSRYTYSNTERRNEVVFYARPPTPRRATEFGLLALRELNRLRPDITINLIGWDMSGYDVPFPHVNHGAVDIARLDTIYNRSAAGLVLSLTNMSLLPMEVMASGVVPVVNDAPNTRGVFDSPYIEYVPMSPKAIAERLIAIVDRPDAVEHGAAIAHSVDSAGWSDPAETFIAVFEKAMRTAL